MKFTKYNLLFLFEIMTGEILSFIDLSIWFKVGILCIIAITIMIIFRDKP